MTDAPLVRKTSVRLADGRALHYFDDSEPYVSGRATRSAADLRPPAPRTPPGEVRFDERTGEHVVIAPARAERTHLPAAADDPLLPSAAGRRTEIPAGDYDVVVFDNRFPALEHCEVISYSPDPAVTVGGLTARRMRTVVEAWADRTRELGALPGVEQVFCFENRGEEIGVTLPHAHGQIYAYPFVPPAMTTLLRRVREHAAATGRGLYADRVAAELADGARIVLRTDHWVAYVPRAARWPVEVEVVPLRDVADLPGTGDAERRELAALYPALVRRLDAYFAAPGGAAVPLPYVAAWYQAPAAGPVAEGFRLHLRFTSNRRAPGKLKHIAGSEAAMGAWISDTVPERVAARLRACGSAAAERA